MAEILYNWYERGQRETEVKAFDELWLGLLIERYGDGVNGWHSWRNYWTDFSARSSGIWTPDPSEQPTWRPVSQRCCVFISHKRDDEAPARAAAQWAVDAGHDVWLDVLDPWLIRANSRPDSRAKSLAIAAIIEMGLINSTHVLAVMTDATAKSRWVPYEYGRVRDDSTLSVVAASWRLTKSKLPTYHYLGPGLVSDSDVRGWLQTI